MGDFPSDLSDFVQAKWMWKEKAQNVVILPILCYHVCHQPISVKSCMYVISLLLVASPLTSRTAGITKVIIPYSRFTVPAAGTAAVKTPVWLYEISHRLNFDIQGCTGALDIRVGGKHRENSRNPRENLASSTETPLFFSASTDINIDFICSQVQHNSNHEKLKTFQLI